jgi:hypothetical protein
MNKYKIWEIVLLPRYGNYNPKYDRDIQGKIKEIRKGRFISYLIWKSWYLEELLRPINSSTISLYAKDQD